MKKRLIAIFVPILSALLLAACIGNGTSSDQSGEHTTPVSEKVGETSSEGAESSADETSAESDGSYQLPPMPIG